MNPLYFKEHMAWFLPLIIWSLFWKGLALWDSAKSNQGKWFVAILVLNTAGILEIIYYFGFAKKKWSDVTNLVQSWFTKLSPPTPPTQ